MIIFFKSPANKRILDAIKLETYPEYAPISSRVTTSEATEAEEPAAAKAAKAKK